jgi:hypothetical protein
VALKRRRGGLRAGAPTLVLAVVAAGTVGALVVVEYSRVWKRGRAPLPADADEPFRAAAEAAAETAEVAIVGYREASTRENALFNLLASFVISFISVRSVTYLLRERASVGPFRDLKVGRRHIHHFIPGITLAFVSGGVAIVTRNETLARWMALPFGAGMGLTLDESALLLELDDVYWSEEGILSVQITLAVTALLAATALAARVLLRGEQEVLPDTTPAPPGR